MGAAGRENINNRRWSKNRTERNHTMHYEGDIYRPPSEAQSLIIQVTVGCTHNGCTFCSMYKADSFKIKPFEMVLEDLHEARRFYKYVERIFFADGDALCLETDKLLRLFEAARLLFTECSRVGIYGRASQILHKTDEELTKLRDAGLGIIYLGAESGSEEVLRRINKGDTAAQTIDAVKKAEAIGLKTSVTFISGLGGTELMREHAIETGNMISEMGASYVGFLTLLVEPAAPLYADIQSGAFMQLTPLQVLDEQELVLENTDCTEETVFRSNHASNWLVLKGTLPQDKARMLAQIKAAKADASALRQERFRRL